MRSVAIIVAALIFSAIAYAADDPTRTALVSRLESQYFSMSGIGADSPMLDLMLADARKLNPEVDDASWRDVKTEAATAVISAMTAKGSALNAYFGAALDDLSTAELKRLSSLLADPVYMKFHRAMTNSENQKRLLQGIMGDPMVITSTINRVLESRGLKVPH